MFEEEAVKHYENLTKSALRLNEIVKEQQQRMNKAIEYINNVLLPYGKENDWDDIFIQNKVMELLEILKGKNNDR